jgi:hypothetical protein
MRPTRLGSRSSPLSPLSPPRVGTSDEKRRVQRLELDNGETVARVHLDEPAHAALARFAASGLVRLGRTGTMRRSSAGQTGPAFS